MEQMQVVHQVGDILSQCSIIQSTITERDEIPDEKISQLKIVARTAKILIENMG